MSSNLEQIIESAFDIYDSVSAIKSSEPPDTDQVLKTEIDKIQTKARAILAQCASAATDTALPDIKTHLDAILLDCSILPVSESPREPKNSRNMLVITRIQHHIHEIVGFIALNVLPDHDARGSQLFFKNEAKRFAIWNAAAKASCDYFKDDKLKFTNANPTFAEYKQMSPEARAQLFVDVEWRNQQWISKMMEQFGTERITEIVVINGRAVDYCWYDAPDGRDLCEYGQQYGVVPFVFPTHSGVAIED